MTDRRRTAAEREAAARERATRKRRRRPSAYPVVAGSLAAFMGLFGYMTYQLKTGHDPALGNQAAKVAVAPVKKRIVLKRIEHRIVVTKVIPVEEEDGASAAVVQQSVPVQSAPVQQSAPVVIQRSATPAPAPAPAPAPIQTSTS